MDRPGLKLSMFGLQKKLRYPLSQGFCGQTRIQPKTSISWYQYPKIIALPLLLQNKPEHDLPCQMTPAGKMAVQALPTDHHRAYCLSGTGHFICTFHLASPLPHSMRQG